MKLGEGLRQREQEQNEAEIDEITPSVLKQIENMPKDRRSLEYFFKCSHIFVVSLKALTRKMISEESEF